MLRLRRVSPVREEAGRGVLAAMPACKHVALGVEMGSSTSHSLGDMGLEGQGCQIKASDPLPWVQGEGTAGGCLEASEEAVTGPRSPLQPHWGFPGADGFSPPVFAHYVSFARFALPMPELMGMDRWGPRPTNACVLPQVRGGGGIPHPEARRAVGSGGCHAQGDRVLRASPVPPLSPAPSWNPGPARTAAP